MSDNNIFGEYLRKNWAQGLYAPYQIDIQNQEFQFKKTLKKIFQKGNAENKKGKEVSEMKVKNFRTFENKTKKP